MPRPVVSARFAAAGLLLAAAFGTFASAGRHASGVLLPEPRRPNVVILSIDTLSREALSAFSDSAPRLPNLDAFAGQSARFLGALSPAAWTLPAHASVLTGLYPDRHGATDRRARLFSDVRTLAELLRRDGYLTVAFTDGGYVDAHYGLARGFDRYDASGLTIWWPRIRLPRSGRAHRAQGAVFDRALAFLGGRSSEPEPFLLFLHTYAVHDYYRLALDSPEHAHACLTGKLECAPSEWDALRARYAAETRRLDGEFGELAAALRAVARREPTFVFVLSDHGEGFDPAHGRIHHGGRLHSDQLRVPLLLSGPGVVPRDVLQPVSLVDVAPTVLDLARVADRPELDGSSFAGAAFGGTGAARPLLAMEHFYVWQGGRRLETFAVSDVPLASAWIDGNRWRIDAASGSEEYDTLGDPEQLRPLPSAHAAPTSFLADRKRYWRPREAIRVPPGLRQRLRALGYLD